MTDNKGRALREISLAGCSCIGKGKNGAVYRLDEETIVKMFDPDSRAAEGCKPDSRRLAEQEQQKAKAAIDLGVPTAIPHGVVRSGESFGLVLEFINARSLRDVIVKEPGRRMTLGADSARLLRKLHGLRVPPGILPRMSDTYRQRAAGLADLLSAEEIMLLNEMIDSILERPTYVHGDFHRGISWCGGRNCF